MGGKGGGGNVENTIEPTDMSPLEMQFKNLDKETIGAGGHYQRKTTDTDEKEGIATTALQVSLPEQSQEAAKALQVALMDCIRTSSFCEDLHNLIKETRTELTFARDIEPDLKQKMEDIKKDLLQSVDEKLTEELRYMICQMGTARTSWFMDFKAKALESAYGEFMEQFGKYLIQVKGLSATSRATILDDMYNALISARVDLGTLATNITVALKGAKVTDTQNVNRSLDRDVKDNEFKIYGVYEHQQISQAQGQIPPDGQYAGVLGMILGMI